MWSFGLFFNFPRVVLTGGGEFFFGCRAVAPKKEQTPKKMSLNVERNIQEVLNHKSNTTGECRNSVSLVSTATGISFGFRRCVGSWNQSPSFSFVWV